MTRRARRLALRVARAAERGVGVLIEWLRIGGGSEASLPAPFLCGAYRPGGSSMRYLLGAALFVICGGGTALAALSLMRMTGGV